jgi:hypothetical protein
MAKKLEMLPDSRCAGCSPAWGNQPSPDAYRGLMNSLFALEVGVRTEHIDRLDAGVRATQSVLKYLNSDAFCVRLGLTKLLGSIMHALHDTSQGAKPPLFFNRKAKPAGGAPSYLAESGLRAQVVLMFRVLMHAKMKDSEANKWLATELNKSGVKQKKTKKHPYGQPIEARQIIRWSGELGGKSISGSDATYRILESGYVARHGWPTHFEEARLRIRKLIHGLRAAGF